MSDLVLHRRSRDDAELVHVDQRHSYAVASRTINAYLDLAFECRGMMVVGVL